jgi:hypothetical protein
VFDHSAGVNIMIQGWKTTPSSLFLFLADELFDRDEIPVGSGSDY